MPTRHDLMPCPGLPVRAGSVVLLALITIAGCSGPESPGLQTEGFVCKNEGTGLCEPCVGVSVCVDPIGCKVIPCGGGDVLFGDTGATVDTTAAADTSTDIGAADAATDAADTSDAQADAADSTASIDTAGTDVADAAETTDTGPPGCTAGTTGCLDKVTPALCVAGAWQAVTSCPSGYGCDDGTCVCAKECEAIGQKVCSGTTVAAVKTCELDASGCLRYGVPVACNPDELCNGGLCSKKSGCDPACPQGQICDNGVCKTDPNTCTPACQTAQICQSGQCVGTLSCGQVMACIEQFAAPGDTLTIDTCIAKGTPTAQAQYKARKACIALSCQTLIDAGKAYEALLCVYSKCATEQTVCTGVGSNDCGGLGGCLAGCGTSTVCTSACHSQASVSAIQKWYGLLLCGEQYCQGKSGDAFAQCTAQLCGNAYQACFGSTGQGGYTCAQVLQCAGQCGSSKDCAQNCKAQASAAGLSALTALLACNDKYCTSICNGGSAQQCDQCGQVYCGKEWSACQ
ncbi:MAG: hypothetical protein H6747_12435 [Deltaproteobacteria bacterium]|nr:hypothetical protein [Deltaproteobacteria bacterium]